MRSWAGAPKHTQEHTMAHRWQVARLLIPSTQQNSSRAPGLGVLKEQTAHLLLLLSPSLPAAPASWEECPLPLAWKPEAHPNQHGAGRGEAA